MRLTQVISPKSQIQTLGPANIRSRAAFGQSLPSVAELDAQGVAGTHASLRAAGNPTQTPKGSKESMIFELRGLGSGKAAKQHSNLTRGDRMHRGPRFLTASASSLRSPTHTTPDA